MHADLTASAWLIRRVINEHAEFLFVHDPNDVHADAMPFDMRGVRLSQHGGDCAFETMLKQYRLDDPTLRDIARIVHEADLEDERDDAPEAPEVDEIVRGVSLLADSDDQMLALTGLVFDGLYEYRRRATMVGRAPS